MSKPNTDRKERAFFIRLTDDEREQVRAKMKRLKAVHRVSMSAVLREVLLNHLDDEDFLREIGMIE